LARRRNKPDPSHTPAHPSREPRRKGARPTPRQQQAVPRSDDVRRRLAHLAEVERLAQIGSWEWDIANDRVTWSAELYRILGVAEELEATLAGALELAHPDDRARLRETIERAHRDRMPYECEHRIVRRSDGAVRVVRSRGMVVCDREGRPLRMYGTAQDVTERRQVEATSTARFMSERRRAADAVAQSEAQLRAFAGKLRSARESERTHIAREIHDELGQALTALKMDLFSLRQSVPEPLRDPLLRKTDQMASLIDQMVDKVRTLASELRPAVLDNLGLSAAVEWAVRQFAQRTGIECALDLPRESLRIDSDRSTDVFRILQEALTNVARHARATRVDVHLRATPGELVLEVHDNGRGISDREIDDPGAFGLLGMRERVLPWGGEVGVRASPQGGTSVTVCIPMHHDTPGAAA